MSELPPDLGLNVHRLIGWNRCANLDCLAVLEPDCVVLVTTTKMRRFCSVECINEGKKAWDAVIADTGYYGISVKESVRRRLRTVIG